MTAIKLWIVWLPGDTNGPAEQVQFVATKAATLQD